MRPEMDAWGGDVAILISKSMHFGRMLPGRGPFSRIRRKRDAYGAILASQGPGADAPREGGGAGGGARWARWGRGESNGCGQQRGGTQVMGCDGNGRRREAGMGRGMAGALGAGDSGPGSGKRGTWERAAAESSAGERRWRRMGAGCGRWHISGCSGTVAIGDGCCEGGCAGKEK